MRYGESDPTPLYVRTIAVSVAMQALVARLVGDGVLDKGDLIAMREVGLQLAADLGEHAELEGTGRMLAREVEAWWREAEGLAGA